MQLFGYFTVLKRDCHVPVFDKIVYTKHAELRMRERHISQSDVEFVLRNGEGRPGEDDDRVYEVGRYRVVVVEEGSTVRVLTVIRRKGRR
jgi:hypothetical protein